MMDWPQWLIAGVVILLAFHYAPQMAVLVAVIAALSVGGLYLYRRSEEQGRIDNAKQRERDEQHNFKTLERQFHDDVVATVKTLRPEPAPGLFQVRLAEGHPHPGLLVLKLVAPLFKSRYGAANEGLLRTYLANLQEVSEAELGKTGAYLQPPDYNKSDIFERYLKDTGLEGVFDGVTVPVDIPQQVRYEHGVIVGKTGAGKSQLLEKLILADLALEEPPGMLIIDSKADTSSLFNRIPRLDIFHPEHGRLRGRLILIDPVNDRPALNMFDVPGELTNAKVNQINNSMRYFFGGLLGDDLSNQMNTLFLPLLHVILRVPGATLHDLQKLVRDPLEYPDILEQLPAGIRRFLVEEFSARNEGYRATKQAIVTRIQGIINEVTLDEMFSASRNAVDIADALGKGAIILVSTNSSALQHLSPIFGKYWIAQMLSAGMSRQTDRPIHFYCDEAAPYVDDKLVSLLTTIRSYKVGLMLAFQGVWQMGMHARAILSNTDIKLVSGLDEGDAKDFEPFYRGVNVRTLMAAQKRRSTGVFALHHRELPRAVTVEFEFGELDRQPLMSETDYQLLRQLNRMRLEAPPARRPAATPEVEREPEPALPVRQRLQRPRKRQGTDTRERTAPTGDWEP